MAARGKSSYLQTLIIWILAVSILVPSLCGFAVKFLEFVSVYRESSDGAFAIAPMVNYFLATTGFFLLLLWATCNGMFSDVERPKYWMLENEQSLDQQLATGVSPEIRSDVDVRPLNGENLEFVSCKERRSI